MIELNEDGYIIGWSVSNENEKINIQKITIENHFDRFRNPQWKWINNKAVFSPRKLTAEQKEKDRTDAIEKEISYTIQQEIALINKGIKNKDDEEYLAYRIEVDKIKARHLK